jgi:hypothetical protein
MSGTPLLMRCSGCGAEISLDDPAFSEWWVEHSHCLSREPASEIDHRMKAILAGTPSEDT